MAQGACSEEEVGRHLESLRGLSVALPWKGYGSAIFLELGQLSPVTSKRRHHDRGEACIAVEWDWRVEAGRTVLYGSSNSRPEIERGIAGLRAATVTDIAVEGVVPELVVQFSNGHCLRSMVMVDGDPQWSIRLPGEVGWVYPRAGMLFVGDGTSEVTDEESAVFALAEVTATRWGVPTVSPVMGRCSDCRWFMPVDGEGHLLDYGVCIAASGPLDGRAVNRSGGCPAFVADEHA